MINTNLRFHFHGGQTSLFRDLTDEVVKQIFDMLKDSRIESFVIGSQWLNKNGIITVYPEVADKVPGEDNESEISMSEPDVAA